MLCVYIYMIYIHPSIHTYIHPSIHTYIHTSIHPYIHTSIHPYIHTYIHTSIHACIHTYIHNLCCLNCLFCGGHIDAFAQNLKSRLFTILLTHFQPMWFNCVLWMNGNHLAQFGLLNYFFLVKTSWNHILTGDNFLMDCWLYPTIPGLLTPLIQNPW